MATAPGSLSAQKSTEYPESLSNRGVNALLFFFVHHADKRACGACGLQALSLPARFTTNTALSTKAPFCQPGSSNAPMFFRARKGKTGRVEYVTAPFRAFFISEPIAYFPVRLFLLNSELKNAFELFVDEQTSQSTPAALPFQAGKDERQEQVSIETDIASAFSSLAVSCTARISAAGESSESAIADGVRPGRTISRPAPLDFQATQR